MLLTRCYMTVDMLHVSVIVVAEEFVLVVDLVAELVENWTLQK